MAGTRSKKISSTGTINTDKKSLSASDICRIIKQCGESFVSEIEIEGFRAKFYPPVIEDTVEESHPTDEKQKLVSNIPNLEIKDEMTVMDQDLLDEAEEAQALIDDAASYEKMQVARHIERRRTE